MEELSTEEKQIIQKWREIKMWGYLEVSKQNGKLFEIKTTHVERPIKN